MGPPRRRQAECRFFTIVGESGAISHRTCRLHCDLKEIRYLERLRRVDPEAYQLYLDVREEREDHEMLEFWRPRLTSAPWSTSTRGLSTLDIMRRALRSNQLLDRLEMRPRRHRASYPHVPPHGKAEQGHSRPSHPIRRVRGAARIAQLRRESREKTALVQKKARIERDRARDSAHHGRLPKRPLSLKRERFTLARSGGVVATKHIPETGGLDELKRFRCSLKACKAKFFSSDAAISHFVHTHYHGRVHGCPYSNCGLWYRREVHLKKHMEAYHHTGAASESAGVTASFKVSQ